MPWFKVDDAFHGHPKVMELSPAAVGIWTLAGSWCANYLTDGEIKLPIARRLGADAAMIQELVDAGLWIDMGGAYQFKDWAEYQPLRAEVMAERNAARERMKSVRAKKKGVERSGEHIPNVQPNNTGTFAGTSEEVRVTPTQSRPSPVPTRPPEGGGKPAPSKGQAGTRIPANFTTTPEMISWALDNAPNVNTKASTQKFKAHYRSVSGPQQFKTDWVAAWESWLLSDQQRADDKPQQFKTGAEKRLEQGRANHDLFAQMDAERANAAKEITQ